MNEKAVKEKTGKELALWYEFLDASGFREKAHKEIADYLHDVEKVDYWWAQTITVEYEKFIGRRIKGQTADGLFQLGIRKTFSLSPEELWHKVIENPQFWGDDQGPGEIDRFSTLKEGSHFRMAWSKKGWETHSILQVRILESSNPEKSVLAIHQEKLPHLQARQELLEHWEDVIKSCEQI